MFTSLAKKEVIEYGNGGAETDIGMEEEIQSNHIANCPIRAATALEISQVFGFDMRILIISLFINLQWLSLPRTCMFETWVMRYLRRICLTYFSLMESYQS